MVAGQRRVRAERHRSRHPFATVFFDEPQVLGQFRLLNRRSNNVANNAFYAVTQFDLVFRIDRNCTTFGQTGLSFTGVAEVAFLPVLEASAWLLLGLGGVARLLISTWAGRCARITAA